MDCKKLKLLVRLTWHVVELRRINCRKERDNTENSMKLNVPSTLHLIFWTTQAHSHSETMEKKYNLRLVFTLEKLLLGLSAITNLNSLLLEILLIRQVEFVVLPILILSHFQRKHMKEYFLLNCLVKTYNL